MPKIYVLIFIGLPGAGKTTFCTEIIKNNEKFNVVHICFDEYVKMENLERYKNNRTKLIYEIKNLIDSIKSKSAVTDIFLNSTSFINKMANYIILIDDNNYYKGMRYEFYKICKYFSISFIQIYFALQLTEVLEQNQNRKTGYVPEDIIKKMHTKLQIPSAKCSWEIGTFVVNDQINIKWHDFFCYIEKNSVIPKQNSENKISCHQSEVHNIDLALRKHINYLITKIKNKNSEQDIKMLAKKLNIKRKNLLEDLGSGILNINDDIDNFFDILSYESQECF